MSPDAESEVPDAVNLTQSSNDGAASEASDSCRFVVLCCLNVLLGVCFQLKWWVHELFSNGYICPLFWFSVCFVKFITKVNSVNYVVVCHGSKTTPVLFIQWLSQMWANFGSSFTVEVWIQEWSVEEARIKPTTPLKSVATVT